MLPENWHTISGWLADHGILMAACASFLLTVLIHIAGINKKLLTYLVFTVTGLTILLSLEFYPLQFLHSPVTTIPVLGIFITCFLFISKNNSVLKRYSMITYILMAVLFIVAIECAKSSMNTWGSGPIYAGVFMIVHILALFQLIRLLYQQDKIYGVIKLITGIAALLMMVIFGFDSGEYNGDTVTLIRRSVIILCISTISEGIFLFYNPRNIQTIKS